MCRNSCIPPKIMKLVLLDSSSLDLLRKNIVLHVTLLYIYLWFYLAKVFKMLVYLCIALKIPN